MSSGDAPKDVFRGYRFKVEIGGITRAGFRECSGLDAANDSVDYREGDEDPHLHKLLGLQKYSNITLKRGITDDVQLWEWRKKVMAGKMTDARQTVHIKIIDDEGKDAAEWTLVRAWPTKWTGPTFNATANEVAIDTVEITHEGLERAK
jgi:phage tail-like protein